MRYNVSIQQSFTDGFHERILLIVENEIRDPIIVSYKNKRGASRCLEAILAPRKGDGGSSMRDQNYLSTVVRCSPR